MQIRTVNNNEIAEYKEVKELNARETMALLLAGKKVHYAELNPDVDGYKVPAIEQCLQLREDGQIERLALNTNGEVIGGECPYTVNFMSCIYYYIGE